MTTTTRNQPRADDRPLAALLGDSPAAAFIIGPDARIREANHGPHGEPASLVLGRAIDEMFAASAAEELRVAAERALEKGEAARIEFGEQGQSGASGWWEASVHRLSAEDGGETRALCLLVDVTERKRREDRLRRSESLLVDAQGVAHMGTWEWDVSQPTAYWSPELYRIYGLTEETYTPSYEGYLKMVHPDDRQRVMDVTERCFKHHESYSHDERIFRPDGSLRYLHTWAQPVLDEEGKLVRLVGVCQDITEQKRAEGAMRTQTLTRALARRLIVDLIGRGDVPQNVIRQVGRGLVSEHETNRPVQEYVESFVDMGLGNLRVEKTEGTRYTFAASDLIERRNESALPTCFATLGYIEGVVSAITGKRALGNEMRCQSMGHKECTFVVAAQS